MTTVFMFPGQSSRYPEMLDRLAIWAEEDTRAVLGEASDALGRDLRAHYRADNPAIFATNRDVQLGVFLANHIHLLALERAGVRAGRSLGLSLGEYNHLVHAGALGFLDALRLVDARGAAYDEGPEGVMASVFPLPIEELLDVVARARAAGRLEIANFNSPLQHVIAGDRAAIEVASGLLDDEHGVDCAVIEQRIPMHTSMFAPVAESLRPALLRAPWRTPRKPYLPNVLGYVEELPTPARIVELLAQRHVFRPVRFRESIDWLVRQQPRRGLRRGRPARGAARAAHAKMAAKPALQDGRGGGSAGAPSRAPWRSSLVLPEQRRRAEPRWQEAPHLDAGAGHPPRGAWPRGDRADAPAPRSLPLRRPQITASISSAQAIDGHRRIDPRDPIFVGHFPAYADLPRRPPARDHGAGSASASLSFACAGARARGRRPPPRRARLKIHTALFQAEVRPGTISRSSARSSRATTTAPSAPGRSSSTTIRSRPLPSWRSTLSKPKRIAITGMAINTPLGDTLDGFREALLCGASAVTRWKELDVLPHLQPRSAPTSPTTSSPPTSSRASRGGSRPTSTAACAASSARPLGPPASRCSSRRRLPRRGPLRRGDRRREDRRDRRGPQHQLQLPVREPTPLRRRAGLHGSAPRAHGARHRSRGLRLRGARRARPHLHDGRGLRERQPRAAAASTRCATTACRPRSSSARSSISRRSSCTRWRSWARSRTRASTTTPEKASRPFDTRREGFVPAHGGGVLVLEEWESALRRGAEIYAEVVGVECNSDANHLPQPSEEGQSRLMSGLLAKTGLEPWRIDYINAHATSTPLGDVTEIRSIKRVFGEHAYRLKLNATKSMLGHTCWAAPVVETVAAVLQMNAGRLHPSINVVDLDPEMRSRHLPRARRGAADSLRDEELLRLRRDQRREHPPPPGSLRARGRRPT
jgi:[acyl-carrier-protein] S-malonyltransferase